MPTSQSAEDLATRLSVEDAVVRVFVATDERDWPTLEDCFTDPFTLDMTSMVGGSSAVMTPQQVAKAWADGFKSLDHVHHQIGNMRTEISRSQTLVKCYGVAFHSRAKVSGLGSRAFVGTYEPALRQFAASWRIGRLVFKLKFIDGNFELEKAL